MPIEPLSRPLTHPADYPAPTVSGPLDAVVTLPGSKSLTNRFLVLAALAHEPSRIRRPLRSRDTLLMAQALRALGVSITDHETADAVDWIVEPGPLRGPATIDCGLAGTVMRFLPPVAALATGLIDFDGDEQARSRPVGPVLDALRALGVEVDGSTDGLPFTVRGDGQVRGGTVTIDASTSSQFVSALLLSGARFTDGVTVRHDGKAVPSLPHIQMTIEVLRDAGVVVDDGDVDTWRVEPSPISALDVVVEPDLSNAATFLGAAMVTGGRVRVPGWPIHTTQGGDHIREILERLGASVTLDRDGLTVTGPRRLEPVDLDLHEASELTPVVAAIAAFADGTSYLRGVAHIRGHETDRLAALATELNRLGGRVEETEDGLIIRPAPLHGGLFHTYADHRMAMAAAVIGAAVPGVVIQDVATTGKTLPDFARLWSAFVAGHASARPLGV